MNNQFNLKFCVSGVVCALALAACGGGGSSGTATTATPAAATATATLTFATYTATPYSGGTATTFTVKSVTVKDSGLAAKTNRIVVTGSGGGFEREIQIYVVDSDCSIFNISHAWAPTAAVLSGPSAISTSVSSPAIGPTLGLEPATNTITFNDTLLDGNAPDASTLKGTVKPSTKICASATV